MIESTTECGSEFISEAQPIQLPGLSAVLMECQYFPEHYGDSLFESLGIDFPKEVQRAVIKRKAEFLAGRYCAQQILQKTGHSNYQVSIGEQRSPQWPSGVHGAITHAGNIAMCALSTESSGLGVDYELPIPEVTAGEIRESIITQTEALRLSSISSEINQWLTIAFSVKESLFKALYPTVNQYFDFLDAEITHIDPGKQTISLALTRTLCPEAESGQQFHGAYHFHRDGFLTFIEF